MWDNFSSHGSNRFYCNSQENRGERQDYFPPQHTGRDSHGMGGRKKSWQILTFRGPCIVIYSYNKIKYINKGRFSNMRPINIPAGCNKDKFLFLNKLPLNDGHFVAVLHP
jgi:hypothetical protein